MKKLISAALKDGFQQLRMDDISKRMDVSRATMYKHFSSKEEVLEGVVDVYVDYINSLVIQTDEEGTEISYGTRFQFLFEQSVLLIRHIGSGFLKELQAIYPDSYSRLKDAMQTREQQIAEFYRDGMARGIFNQLNEKFIILQDDVLLREIIHVKYLMLNQASIQQVLYDYYQFKKIQLFKADKLPLLDDSRIDPIIDHIVQKFNRAL
ncbi:TetR/AcrR family transcriptional regulator [Paenibacillus sepulcri]|uniref:TetR/AcrR family transcriptional regulator n=1 Tax=Paenibacillus sepulcri TaxID=359917 RepID=UPI0035F029C5